MHWPVQLLRYLYKQLVTVENSDRHGLSILQNVSQNVYQTSGYYHVRNFELKCSASWYVRLSTDQRYEHFTVQDTLWYQFTWASLKLTPTSVTTTPSFTPVPLRGVCKYGTCRSVSSVTATCRQTSNRILQLILSEFFDWSFWSTSVAR
jgi:hypothetical protein